MAVAILGKKMWRPGLLVMQLWMAAESSVTPLPTAPQIGDDIHESLVAVGRAAQVGDADVVGIGIRVSAGVVVRDDDAAAGAGVENRGLQADILLGKANTADATAGGRKAIDERKNILAGAAKPDARDRQGVNVRLVRGVAGVDGRGNARRNGELLDAGD